MIISVRYPSGKIARRFGAVPLRTFSSGNPPDNGHGLRSMAPKRHLNGHVDRPRKTC